jgi:enoyl-[acyl-carrier protein] reductase I
MTDQFLGQLQKKAYEYGAELAFTYQGDALGKRVIPLGESVGSNIILPCEVSEASSIKNVFEKINSEWGKLDFVIHGIAFSDKEELKGQYIDTTRSNFSNTMEISVYSFTEVSKFAVPLMNEGGSLLTLTYYGSERVMPHYNVMGVAKAALEASVRYLAVDLGSKNIRVNSLSAGPMKTLAASGIGDFRYILKWNELNSPLKRNVTQDDVGGAGVYLISDLSTGVSGENHHVDCGYHVVGMKSVDAPDISKV